MVLVQFSHAFDRGDEFWIIFKRQPALIDSGNWRVDTIDTLRGADFPRSCSPYFGIGSLGVEPRVFIFRKRAAPAVGEIKDRHVKDEQGVVPGCASSKKIAQLCS